MKSVEGIPVFKGKTRIRETIDLSVEAIEQGYNLVIFPENPTRKFSEYINDFDTGFIHLAKSYYLKTGKKLISKIMVEGWLGSDNMSTDDFLDLITDIINEDYPLDILRSDVLELMENENA